MNGSNSATIVRPMLQRIHSLHGVDGSRSGVSDDDCACVVAGGIACCSVWNDVTALAAAREVELDAKRTLD